MGDLEPGFYLARKADGNVRLILGKRGDDGDVILLDEYGGVYSANEILTEDYNKGPISVSLVGSLISLDRQRVKFVDKGLAELAEVASQ